MKKKGEFNWVMILFLIWLLLLIFLMTITILHQITFKNKAEEKCGGAGLELFDWSSGTMFLPSTITCINVQTKEIIKIR